jgi:hypothetical protein
MADPDNITLEHLRAIRADLGEVKQRISTLESRMDSFETKLDGLTHAVMSGFGAMVHSLDSLNARLSRLERERA